MVAVAASLEKNLLLSVFLREIRKPTTTRDYYEEESSSRVAKTITGALKYSRKGGVSCLEVARMSYLVRLFLQWSLLP
ncbi:hypothetical protein VNO78_07916 [Psophocarpus tetragonolobus]|uniref:Uncharacterized protein n=1 Tax=Psophocarpus tetragonolobus TaxID=3891 RepID=A0AAN9T438_PSOTE